LRWLNHFLSGEGKFSAWIEKVYAGVSDTNQRYPFLSYGTDWLAFAHLIIAILFIGPLIDPVKNSWIISWGIICCLLVFPLALIAGPIREIPFFHGSSIALWHRRLNPFAARTAKNSAARTISNLQS